jgi:hypothetical protein
VTQNYQLVAELRFGGANAIEGIRHEWAGSFGSRNLPRALRLDLSSS